MRPTLRLRTLALALAVNGACGGTVTPEAASGASGAAVAGSGGASGAGSSSATGSGASSRTDYAIEHGHGVGFEIVVASGPITCEEPLVSGCDTWWLSMSLPQDLAKPGTYPLFEAPGTGALTNTSANGPPTGDGSCDWSGGGYGDEGATITIDEVTAQAVTFSVTGVTLVCDISVCDPNGPHIAPRCP